MKTRYFVKKYVYMSYLYGGEPEVYYEEYSDELAAKRAVGKDKGEILIVEVKGCIKLEPVTIVNETRKECC